MSVPYARARTGQAARQEVTKILRGFGCQSVGFMDDFEDGSTLLAFTHRGRQVQLRASARGWAAMYLRENPWNRARKTSREAYEREALTQGLRAINSILRDWVKGQVTAVECGVLSFEGVFLPYMLTDDGRPLFERIQFLNLLPAPAEKATP
jgi:hypothetical protein